MRLRAKGLDKYFPEVKINWSHFGNWFKNAFLRNSKWGSEEVRKWNVSTR